MHSLVWKNTRKMKVNPYTSLEREEVKDNLQRIAESADLLSTLRAKGMCHDVHHEDESLIVSAGKRQKPVSDAREVVAVTASLKACANQKDLQKGSKIHTDLVRTGLLQNNVFVGSTLVSMYAKCGALEKAQEVFDELPLRNTVTWNVLIAGYAQHGQGKEALRCFEHMQSGGFSPDAFTFSCILKACSSVGALDRGQEIHDQIEREYFLDKDITVDNALVDMYAKCGALEKAQAVFDELRVRNVVSWNALIAGYAQHGHGKEALKYYERMQLGDFSPDAITFANILKACGTIGALEKGQEIHAQIVKEHLLETNMVVGNVLIDMYAKCGALRKAREVFDELPYRNAVLWTALISGYAQHRYAREALNCFEEMHLGGFPPDAATMACILKACGSIGALDKGHEIHSQIVRDGLLRTNVVVANALIDMYTKCGALEKAQEVFNNLLVQDAIAWTTLMRGYTQHGHGHEALKCFERMQLGSFFPDAITFACVLKACGSIEALSKGQEIHARIMRDQLLGKHILVSNALIDMYARCGVLGRAQDVFDELATRNVTSWNVLIAGYAQYGHSKDALTYFERMQSGAISPDAATYACILKACGRIGALDKGHEIHSQIVNDRLLEKHIIIANALVDMYAKCGALETAREVFDELPVRDLILWTALISGYVEHGQGEEAVSCFERMQGEGFYPDAVTFACILKACGGIGAAYKGQNVHAEIVRYGLLEQDLVIGIAVVDFYANCGMLAEAQELFDRLPVRTVVSWSALMVGYAQLGKDEVVLDLFDRMVAEGTEPDSVIFTIILNTCSHRGLLDKGQMYFEIISKVFGIIPTIEHYTILIDLFGRAGHLDMAVAVIEKLPLSANLTMWHTFLGACRKWANMKLGMWAFEQLHDKDAASYVCLNNIFAAAGKKI